jgi:hypothetical protein
MFLRSSKCSWFTKVFKYSFSKKVDLGTDVWDGSAIHTPFFKSNFNFAPVKHRL